MLARSLHDTFYGVSLALNFILIGIILKRTPAYLRSYSIVLLYLAFVEITAAVASLLVYKKVLSTDVYIINSVGGVCRHWGSPFLCFSLNAIHVAAIAHHAVMIAFCSCYRYYVIAFTRGEPERVNVIIAILFIHLPTIVIYIGTYSTRPNIVHANFALVPLLDGMELKLAMNESHPDYGIEMNGECEMLLLVPFNFSSRLASYWVQGIIFPVFIIVTICYSQINNILASIDHMSAASKMRHTRILKGLLCQAILPTLYTFVVVAYRIERRERIKSSEQIGNWMGVIGAILFALSPLFTLIFTPPYRNAMRRILHCDTGSADSSIAPSLNASWTKPSQLVLLNDKSG